MKKYQEQKLLIYALIFGMVYVCIPWQVFLGYDFYDIKNYLNNINSIVTGNYDFLFPTKGGLLEWVKFILKEPLWNFLLECIGTYFSDTSNGLLLISFFNIIVIYIYIFKSPKIFLLKSFQSRLSMIDKIDSAGSTNIGKTVVGLVVKQSHVLLGGFFLLHPIMVNFVLSQVRSSFALAIILISTFLRSKSLIFSCFLCGMLIHSASFVLIPILLVSQRISIWSVTQNLYKLSIVLLCILFAVLLSYFLSFEREFLLAGVDRRAIYFSGLVNLRYVIFWLFISASLIVIPSCYKDRRYYGDFFCFICTMITFFMSFFGGNGVRFLACMYPLLIASIDTRPRKYRIVYYYLLIVYQLISYYYWFQVSL